MTKFFIPTLALLMLPALTFAASPAQTVFTRDGQTYQYSVTEKGDAKFITGKNITSGEQFDFRVAHGRVTGDVEGRPVSFSLSDMARENRVASKQDFAAR